MGKTGNTLVILGVKAVTAAEFNTCKKFSVGDKLKPADDTRKKRQNCSGQLFWWVVWVKLARDRFALLTI